MKKNIFGVSNFDEIILNLFDAQHRLELRRKI